MKTAFKQVKLHFALNFPKPMYLLFALGVLMLAPNYPRIVCAMFAIMLISSLLGITRENRSSDFMSSLPIKRSDIAKGQALFVMAVESIYFVCMAVFAVIACFVPFGESTIAETTVGMYGGVAFFGVMLAVYGVFNLVFFPLYFRGGKCSPSSMLGGMFFGVVAGGIVYMIAEILSQSIASVNAVFTRFDSGVLLPQILILIAGLAVFAALSFVSIKLSEKTYCKEIKR